MLFTTPNTPKPMGTAESASATYPRERNPPELRGTLVRVSSPAEHLTHLLLAGGRHLQYASETPLSNLQATVLDKLGLPVEAFGDSTGTLQSLSEI